MVAKAVTLKTSEELGKIAIEMLMELENRHHLTNGETSLVLHCMQDAEHYSNEANHIQRKLEKQ